MKVRFFIFFIMLALSAAARLNLAPDSTLNRIKKSTDFSNDVKEIKGLLKKDNDVELKVLLIKKYNSLTYYDSALNFGRSNLLVARKQLDTLTMAKMLLNIGNTYYYLNEHNQALNHWKECLNIAPFSKPYYQVVENCTHNMGVFKFETELKFDEAEMYFLKAIEYGKLVGDKTGQNLNLHYRLLGSLYEMRKQFKPADSLFNLIINSYKNVNDYSGLCEAYVFYARSFKTQKNYGRALQLIDTALRYSDLSKKFIDKQTALSMKCEILSDKEDPKEALNAYRDLFYLTVNNSSKELSTKISEAEAKYKVSEARQEKQLLEQQNKQSKQLLFFLFTIGIIIISGTLILFYQRRLYTIKEKNKIENISKVHEVQEKERSRIAQDLHDNMGAYTTSILAQIDALEIKSSVQNDPKVKELRMDAENIMSTLRETIWILKTKSISATNFFDLVKNYCDKHLSKNIGIRVNYLENLDASITLSPTHTLNLYRIIQESVQNIIKHSKAKNVSITFKSDPKFTIEIKDDGIGFDPQKTERQSGLQNMQYRAAEINFSYLVASSPGNGTSIKLAQNTP